MNLMINNLKVSQKRYLCIPEEKTSRYPFLNVPSVMLNYDRDQLTDHGFNLFSNTFTLLHYQWIGTKK